LAAACTCSSTVGGGAATTGAGATAELGTTGAAGVGGTTAPGAARVAGTTVPPCCDALSVIVKVAPRGTLPLREKFILFFWRLAGSWFTASNDETSKA
jgi:hypothetical protein